MPSVDVVKLIRAALAGLLLVALTACPGGPPNGTVLSVTIAGADVSLVIGESQVLLVTVATSGAADDSVTWSSDEPTVVGVDGAGQVTALDAGSAIVTATSNADSTKSDSVTVTVSEPGSVQWTRQFGTGSDDLVFGVAVDQEGNSYVVGNTDGSLAGTSAGDVDAFVRKYDPEGIPVWTRQFGTVSSDRGFGVATDLAGNVFVTGITYGDLEGPSAGEQDAFVRKYDANGDHLWTRQFGTVAVDTAYGVSTDADGNVIVAGETLGSLDGSNLGMYDAFVSVFAHDGEHLWTRQFGTPLYDVGRAAASDGAGNVFVAGYTLGSLEGANAGFADLFIRKYAPQGDHEWTDQSGSAGYDVANGVATDSAGNITVAGSTDGTLVSSAGGVDAFARQYDPAGGVTWTRQFGTLGTDIAFAVATDGAGNVLVSGETDGGLAGDLIGSFDAFVRKMDAAGGPMWTRQFGTEEFEVSRGVAADPDGNVFVAGDTAGSLVGTSAGFSDAFVRKYGR